ncbi:protein glxC [Prescottella equi]|uniref:GltB/FmdC/FwdC-like GXGXG domain-containing protein n=1 Tax=Rhodococcus hoagii TaxID=43767 RepID=UPI0009BE4AAD|nr:protein glxC [Prescottella equi]AVP70084.1 protein glxC [Prescottella equi]MBM4520635.1 protein glxC [Prescottella equi]MBM4532060.1 protein glxC [Prescottella equi]MBM4543263.1 protein glxC [Prescottella equi]MBM4557493.1 protein glxC [Prescottella equi]
MAPLTATPTTTYDVSDVGTRGLNAALQSTAAPATVTVVEPAGAHALACGLDAPIDVRIDGHVGYYAAGMNQRATVTIDGNAGVGVAENMMSGTVRVTGDASQSAGATAHGGLLVIEGNAAARCGISMKGVDIVVGGSIGHMSAFMGQAGRLVVLGDTGEALGDSLYETRIYVRGTVASLGADCIEKEMRDEHRAELRELLDAAGFDADPTEFTRYGSARKLYNFHVDNTSSY